MSNPAVIAYTVAAYQNAVAAGLDPETAGAFATAVAVEVRRHVVQSAVDAAVRRANAAFGGEFVVRLK